MHVRIYENASDVATLRASFAAANAAGQTHSYQVIYDPLTGKLQAWRDRGYLGEWTDTTPLTSGSYLSLRTDSADVRFDDLVVSEVVKYYEIGGQRVAVRKNGAVSYLFGDHLGSTSVTANASGTRTGGTVVQAVGRVSRHALRHDADDLSLHRAARGRQHRAVLLWGALLRSRVGAILRCGYARAGGGESAGAESVQLHAEQPHQVPGSNRPLGRDRLRCSVVGNDHQRHSPGRPHFLERGVVGDRCRVGGVAHRAGRRQSCDPGWQAGIEGHQCGGYGC